MDIESDDERLWRILRLVAEGGQVTTDQDRYVLVENDRYRPDNGEDPYLVVDTWERTC